LNTTSIDAVDEISPISNNPSGAGLSSSVEEASKACTRVLSKAHFKEMATKNKIEFR
jgi:hypothetical protein